MALTPMTVALMMAAATNPWQMIRAVGNSQDNYRVNVLLTQTTEGDAITCPSQFSIGYLSLPSGLDGPLKLYGIFTAQSLDMARRDATIRFRGKLMYGYHRNGYYNTPSAVGDAEMTIARLEKNTVRVQGTFSPDPPRNANDLTQLLSPSGRVFEATITGADVSFRGPENPVINLYRPHYDFSSRRLDHGKVVWRRSSESEHFVINEGAASSTLHFSVMTPRTSMFTPMLESGGLEGGQSVAVPTVFRPTPPEWGPTTSPLWYHTNADPWECDIPNPTVVLAGEAIGAAPIWQSASADEIKFSTKHNKILAQYHWTSNSGDLNDLAQVEISEVLDWGTTTPPWPILELPDQNVFVRVVDQNGRRVWPMMGTEDRSILYDTHGPQMKLHKAWMLRNPYTVTLICTQHYVWKAPWQEQYRTFPLPTGQTWDSRPGVQGYRMAVFTIKDIMKVTSFGHGTYYKQKNGANQRDSDANAAHNPHKPSSSWFCHDYVDYRP